MRDNAPCACTVLVWRNEYGEGGVVLDPARRCTSGRSSTTLSDRTCSSQLTATPSDDLALGSSGEAL